MYVSFSEMMSILVICLLIAALTIWMSKSGSKKDEDHKKPDHR